MTEEQKERRRQARRELYQWNKEHKICVLCLKNIAFEKHTMCPECIEKENLRFAKYRMTNEYKLRHREHNKKNYYKNKELGLCTKCGRKAEEGKVRCAICNSKDKEYLRTKRYKAVPQRELWKQQRLCCLCGKEPAREGKKTGLICHTKMIQGRQRQCRDHIKTQQKIKPLEELTGI